MEFENILRLIEAVSTSALQSLHYEDKELRLHMHKADTEDACHSSIGEAFCAQGQMEDVAYSDRSRHTSRRSYTYSLEENCLDDGRKEDGNEVDTVLRVVKACETKACAIENANTISCESVCAENTISTQGEENIVKSPLVGTFYGAPEEDAPNFVSVGDKVAIGQVLCIVEAMKLMNEIESEYEGTVTEVLAQNGAMVEYGQPLFRIG